MEDNSTGLQLASSLSRSSAALERLGFVLALTTLSLVSLGTAGGQPGKRRLVDPQWFRGISDLQMGWKGVRDALSRGYALLSNVYVSRACDPEPARASKKHDRLRQYRFAFEQQEAA